MVTRHNPEKGFTLIEVLVAMVVLAVGLLGMAAMTVVVIRGNRGAGDLTVATNLCQQKIEGLRDVRWDELGNWSDVTNAETKGYSEGWIFQNVSLDSEGNFSNTGKYIRSFVICRGDWPDYPKNLAGELLNAALPTSTYPQENDCITIENPDLRPRPRSLICEAEDITTDIGSGNKEKKIKVLCSWRSSDGRCHSVPLDTTVVDLY